MSQHQFQTEVSQLLHLMVHSLYSEREIFLRELISNASDACDKLRFESLTDSSLLTGNDELAVQVEADKDAKTITITDSGIGLTEAQAIEHLGTIAKSGTKEFLTKLSEAGKQDDAAGLIGQFGVGFYSSFMVADKVVVESRAAGASSDDGVRWESAGDGTYATEQISRPQRGTTITLHLKEDASEFLDDWRLRGLVKKYSDFVTYPINMWKQVTPPAPSDDDGEDDQPAETEAPSLEQVNAGKPLWTVSKDDISDEQYKEFYNQSCKAWDEPASRLHFTVEGTLSLTALLFFPSQKPFDMFDRNRRGLSLYVRRVFIMDECEDLLPEYLRFVRGVVDSDDLPLNVSREILQQQDTVRKLKKILVKRILDHLAKLARSEEEAEQAAFATIDKEFGATLREGLVNDFENKDKLAKLLRYQSSWTVEQEDSEQKTGLDAYIERMPEGQDSIYYVTAASLAAAKTSPHLEGFVKKGYEVLYMTEAIDEWVVQHLTTHDEKSLVSIAKGAADLGDEEEKKALEEAQENYKDFLGFAGEKLQAGGVKEVRLTGRLTDSPCCLVADEQGMSSNMEEILRKAGQEVGSQQRILELNPEHELVSKLQARHGENAEDPALGDWLQTLHDQALLAEGGRLDDPAGFAKRVQSLMANALA